MKKHLFALGFLLLSVPMMGQETTEKPKKAKKEVKENTSTMTDQTSELFNNVSKDNAVTITNDGTGFVTRYDTRYEGTKGSPYFLPNWAAAKLYTPDGKVWVENAPVKYNTVTKEIYMKRPQGDSISVYPAQVKQFVVEDGKNAYAFTRVYKLKTSSSVLPVAYLLSLYDGNYKVQRLLSKTVKKADYKDAYNPDRRYDEYVDNSEYYVITPAGDYKRVKLKKNDILDLFSDKKVALENFMKTNRLDGKSEADLLAIVKAYEQL